MTEIKEVIKQLRKSAKDSKRNKYMGDWARTLFFVHTLKLLSKIAKKDINEEETIEQEVGKQRFECKQCQGTGFTEHWEGGDEKHKENKIIRDCDTCNGEGSVEINVIDKRKVSKNRLLEFEDKY